MSVVSILSLSEVGWLDVLLASDSVGIPAGRILPGVFQQHQPQGTVHYSGPGRVVYVDDVRVLRSSPILHSMTSVKNRKIVLVLGISPSEVYSSGVESLGVQGGLIPVLTALRETPSIFSPVELSMWETPIDEESEVLSSRIRDSVLQRTTQNLYRLKDHDIRARVKAEVFEYLAGKRARPPETSLPNLDAFLREEVVLRFREACKATKTERVDAVSLRLGIDRFEIGYILRNVYPNNKDVLEMIEFVEDF